MGTRHAVRTAMKALAVTLAVTPALVTGAEPSGHNECHAPSLVEPAQHVDGLVSC